MNHKIELEGETIHLKKSKWLGWGIVYPMKNEDGTINWFNVLTNGNPLKLLFLLVLCVMIIFAIIEYQNNMELCSKAIEFANQFNFGGVKG